MFVFLAAAPWLLNAVLGQVLVGRHAEMLHEQAVQMASADAGLLGDSVDVDVARVIVIDKPQGLLM